MGSLEEEKEPIWFDVAAWDKLADTVSKDFKKGDPVYVAGQVSLHSYTPSVGLDEVTITANKQGLDRLLGPETPKKEK